ncbi:MAG: hypothetical protein ACE5HW_02415, partial [Candidatus Methanofastidiosia archaeon]
EPFFEEEESLLPETLKEEPSESEKTSMLLKPIKEKMKKEKLAKISKSEEKEKDVKESVEASKLSDFLDEETLKEIASQKKFSETLLDKMSVMFEVEEARKKLKSFRELEYNISKFPQEFVSEDEKRIYRESVLFLSDFFPCELLEMRLEDVLSPFKEKKRDGVLYISSEEESLCRIFQKGGLKNSIYMSRESYLTGEDAEEKFLKMLDKASELEARFGCISDKSVSPELIEILWDYISKSKFKPDEKLIREAILGTSSLEAEREEVLLGNGKYKFYFFNGLLTQVILSEQQKLLRPTMKCTFIPSDFSHLGQTLYKSYKDFFYKGEISTPNSLAESFVSGLSKLGDFLQVKMITNDEEKIVFEVHFNITPPELIIYKRDFPTGEFVRGLIQGFNRELISRFQYGRMHLDELSMGDAYSGLRYTIHAKVVE